MKKLDGRRASWQVCTVTLVAMGCLAGVLEARAQSEVLSKPSPTFTEALSAYDEAWASSGLAFNKAIFIDGASSGYGDYTPRANTTFSPEEALSIYAEPVGYGFSETDGRFTYNLTASYKLLNHTGQILAEQANFASFTGNGRSKQRELSAALTFQFNILPAGTYQLEASFSDEVSGATSGFTLPFTVTGEE